MPGAEVALKNDKALVIAAVQAPFSYADELQHFSKKLCDDQEVILAAVRDGPQGGDSPLRYASARLRSDPRMVLLAVTKSEWALQYASDRLRDDRQLVLAAAMQTGESFINASNRLRDDQGLILAVLEAHGPYCHHMVLHASDRLRDNAIFMRKVVALDVRVLRYRYASARLLKDRNFILAVVKIDGQVLGAISDVFHDDLEVVQAALKQNPKSIKYLRNQHYRALFRSGWFIAANLISRQGILRWRPTWMIAAFSGVDPRYCKNPQSSDDLSRNKGEHCLVPGIKKPQLSDAYSSKNGQHMIAPAC